MTVLNRCPHWRSWAKFLLFTALLGCSFAAPAQTPSAVVSRYVAAIQRRDFKTVIDLTYSYQRDVAVIKSQNPQVLWPNLLGQYYSEKMRSLSGNPGYWANYDEALVGDVAQAIRPLQGLVPPACKWAITETRPGPGGTAVYVTVTYPDVGQAPIVGSQLLKQTILQFVLESRTNLALSARRVTQADTFWTGGPDARFAMAKRLFGAGLWDAAISQLEPLESQHELSAEAKDLLASTYFQKVVTQCFTGWTNPNQPGYPKYQTFKGDAQCTASVNKALRLKSGLRKAWARKLLSEARVTFDAGVLDSALSQVAMASQYTDGDQELQSLADKLRLDCALQYLHWAVYNFAAQNHGDAEFVRDDVNRALALSPDLMRTKGLQVMKEAIREAAKEKYKMDAERYLFGILAFMKRFGIGIPSQELSEFLRLADQTDSPAKWRQLVEELASSGGEGASNEGVQPTQQGQSPQAPSPRRQGDTKVNPKDGLTYVWIPPGTFQMGCSSGDSECDSFDERQAHTVTITKGFWMGQTEVMQTAYQRARGTNPSHFRGGRLPVESVTWEEAHAYCGAVGMRLPTEAEWEHAARAGSTASRYGDLGLIAWYGKNSDSQTHEVAQKEPNAWNLYDMLGNVWEWTNDQYDGNYYSRSPSQDPQGPSAGQYRAVRGSSWAMDDPSLARASHRDRYDPGGRNAGLGFRCVGE